MIQEETWTKTLRKRRSWRRIIQNTDTKLIRREELFWNGQGRREKIRLHSRETREDLSSYHTSTLFLPVRALFSPCFLHAFRFLTHTQSVPPINRRIALIFYSILYTFYNAASKRYKMQESKMKNEWRMNKFLIG